MLSKEQKLYKSRPGLREELKKKGQVSLNTEASNADFDAIMRGMLTHPLDFEAKNQVHILHMTEISRRQEVNQVSPRYQTEYLESKIRELLDTVKTKHTVGLPFVYAGHAYYLRLEIENGKLKSPAKLIDSMDKCKGETVGLVAGCLRSINPEIQLDVIPTGYQVMGNTCFDWVARQAYQDLGVEHPLTKADDDVSVRAVTSQVVQESELIPTYESLLQLLNNISESEMSVKFQIELDRRIAEAYQERFQRIADEKAPNEAVIYELAKREAVKNTFEELQVAIDSKPDADEAMKERMAQFKHRFFNLQPCRAAAERPDIQIAEMPEMVKGY